MPRPRDMTWDEYQSATPEQLAVYERWWWATVTQPNMKQWLADEKIDADIYERDKEWVH